MKTGRKREKGVKNQNIAYDMSYDLKEENDMKAKVLRSEYLSRRAWMTARCDTLELPDGRIVRSTTCWNTPIGSLRLP